MIVKPPKNKLAKKNVRYGRIFKATKKHLLNHTYVNDCASQKCVAFILVKCVTILTEPDLSLQI